MTRLLKRLIHLATPKPRPLAAVEQILGRRFNNPSLLERALTHRSFITDRTPSPDDANERLEFLGDAVIELIVVEELCRRFPHKGEGDLSKIKAMLVSGRALQRVAENIGLGAHIRMSGNEARNGGRQRGSILEDAFEAVVAALYLDGGLTAARRFVLSTVMTPAERLVNDSVDINYKSQLLEYSQARNWDSPVYRVVNEIGPDHAKTFAVEVIVNGERMGEGRGSSKKAAQQQAARIAMQRLEVKALQQEGVAQG